MEAIGEMSKRDDGRSPAEGGRRPSGASDRWQTDESPDPEVPEKPERRNFTAEYKLRIIAEADACETPGEVAALLRREGLYSSHLSRWRKKQREAVQGALTPNKRGPEPDHGLPYKRRISDLERENERLRKKLSQAETIIDVQKKVSGLLGIPTESEDGRN